MSHRTHLPQSRFHEMHHLGQGTLGLNHELASKHSSFVVQLRHAVSDSTIKRLYGSFGCHEERLQPARSPCIESL